MPSRELQAISDQIENQQTDSLGKFYLYAALLHVICVRGKEFGSIFPENQSLLATIGISKSKLNVGTLSTSFFRNINTYQTQFKTPVSKIAAIPKLVNAYLRKGQLSDLAFINEQMLAHLNAVENKTLNQNKAIASSIRFIDLKIDLSSLLNAVKEIHENALSFLDTSVNTGVSALTMFAGLGFITASMGSIIYILIGLCLIAGGAFAAYTLFDQLEPLFEKINESISKCTSISKELGGKTINQFGLEDTNFKSFVIDSVLQPLAFSAVTIKEQVAMSEEDAQMNEQERSLLKSTFSS